ncbi:MAG: chorismate synthase [Candidatus Micrarchaeia archaeon]
MNTIGRLFRVSVFGESHGICVGALVDGMPAGIKVSEEYIQGELDRRKPGGQLASKRKEEDRVEILSGVFRGYSTGTPILMLVWNKDVDSSAYEKMKNTPRPGHADYTAFLKYKGYNDYRGGGIFSGRMTAAYVMAGALAKLMLKKWRVVIGAYACQIGSVTCETHYSLGEVLKARNMLRCPDEKKAREMEEEIRRAAEEGDSVGGCIRCIANLPPCLGEPLFDAIDADIAKAVFSIPAVKGVEFGDTKMRGSENNDEFFVKNGRIMTRTNNSGGVLGGITTGMPLEFTVKLKPTPSIYKEQRTVDIKTMKPAKLRIAGRHDPCIVPRAIVVVESVAAFVIADHVLRHEAYGAGF